MPEDQRIATRRGFRKRNTEPARIKPVQQRPQIDFAGKRPHASDDRRVSGQDRVEKARQECLLLRPVALAA